MIIGMSHRYVGMPALTQTAGPTEIAEPAEVPSVAVVIDVMRAFTVAAWVFARGAERIVLAASEEEALALKGSHAGWLALKDGAPAAGYDAVNSPGLVRVLELGGRTVVVKTTAGTVGAMAVEKVMRTAMETDGETGVEAALVLCASFVVAGATARFLRVADDGRVTFVITGEGGRADEDLACAEYIARRLGGGDGASDVDVAPYLRRARESRAAADLTAGVRRGYRGVHPDDVELCLEVDRFPFAMVALREESMLVLRPVEIPR
jgi:2-phosphosulfolactate phosphatase